MKKDFFNFQETLYNPKCSIFQGGLMPYSFNFS